MRDEHHKVARAYVLYREQRAASRYHTNKLKEQVGGKVSAMTVTKRDGSIELVSLDKITNRVSVLSTGLSIDPIIVAQKAIPGLYNEIETGVIYTGDWKDDKLHGLVTITKSNREIFSGYYKNGNPKYKTIKVNGAPVRKKQKILQGERIEHPDYMDWGGIKKEIDYSHYISNQIMNPVKQVLDLKWDEELTSKIFDKYIQK